VNCPTWGYDLGIGIPRSSVHQALKLGLLNLSKKRIKSNVTQKNFAGNVADMSRHVGDDTTCRSNFGQMGPCRQHKIEYVVAVCVSSSRHLPDFLKCVCRNILWYRSTYAQILSHLSTLISCSPVCHVLAGDNAHPHNTDKREHSQFNYTMNSAPQHHPPMPPTKAMGAITQNRRGHPTATP